MAELQRVLLQQLGYGAALSDGGSSPVDMPRAIVFCRGVQSARAVKQTLQGAGFPAGGCHGSMPEQARQSDLADFVAQPPVRPVLVATDLTARGIDFPNVQHVVNFDFPATSALYLHRAGRTARFGEKGEVLSLVHSSERRFAESIRDAVERRSELHVVRKGDLRERKRLANAGGKAWARSTLGDEALRLRRRKGDGGKSKLASKGRRYGKTPVGVPAWRVHKYGS